MPHNGETNRKLGFFSNRCCGKEIVVPAGSEFPACPNHPEAITIWESIDNNLVQLIERRKNVCLEARFKVGDRVTFVGVGTQRGKRGGVVEVLEGALDQVHRYQVQLNDGAWIRCFGFELEFLESESSKSA